ncbi:unnamed protein product, partial [Cyprideis torosa]
ESRFKEASAEHQEHHQPSGRFRNIISPSRVVASGTSSAEWSLQDYYQPSGRFRNIISRVVASGTSSAERKTEAYVKETPNGILRIFGTFKELQHDRDFELRLTTSVSFEEFKDGYSISGILERGDRSSGTMSLTHHALVKRKGYESQCNDTPSTEKKSHGSSHPTSVSKFYLPDFMTNIISGRLPPTGTTAERHDAKLGRIPCYLEERQVRFQVQIQAQFPTPELPIFPWAFGIYFAVRTHGLEDQQVQRVFSFFCQFSKACSPPAMTLGGSSSSLSMITQ